MANLSSFATNTNAVYGSIKRIQLSSPNLSASINVPGKLIGITVNAQFPATSWSLNMTINGTSTTISNSSSTLSDPYYNYGDGTTDFVIFNNLNYNTCSFTTTGGSIYIYYMDKI